VPKKTGTIHIKWVRSSIGFSRNQDEVVRSIGLRRLNQVVERPDTVQYRGLVAKVCHLVEVVEPPAVPAWTKIPEYKIVPAEPKVAVPSPKKAVKKAPAEAPAPTKAEAVAPAKKAAAAKGRVVKSSAKKASADSEKPKAKRKPAASKPAAAAKKESKSKKGKK
jgi:large subunit ribosomal protein L30